MCNVEGPPLKKKRIGLMAPGEPMPIYLDHNATTPVCDEAWAAMTECRFIWGNPSSTHPFGLEAKHYVEEARKTVADAIGAETPECIVFTSGGTESNNMAVIGGFLSAQGKSIVKNEATVRNVIISTVFEHPAIEEVLKHLEKKENAKIVRVPVDKSNGLVLMDKFSAAVEEHKAALALVTVMHANNEIGSVQPIKEMVAKVRGICGDGNVVFHTDSSQSIGKVRVDAADFGVDFLTVCSHKFYGPKGIGALYCRGGVGPTKVTFGAGHERGIRPGTESIILERGMAAALKSAVGNLAAHAEHMRACRQVLYDELVTRLKARDFVVKINGSLETALPNTLNVAIYHPGTQTYISANRLLGDIGLQVAASAGAACHSPSGEDAVVSPALLALDVSVQHALGSLRLSTGVKSTAAEMKRAASLIATRSAQQLGDW